MSYLVREILNSLFNEKPIINLLELSFQAFSRETKLKYHIFLQFLPKYGFQQILPNNRARHSSAFMNPMNGDSSGTEVPKKLSQKKNMIFEKRVRNKP